MPEANGLGCRINSIGPKRYIYIYPKLYEHMENNRIKKNLLISALIGVVFLFVISGGISIFIHGSSLGGNSVSPGQTSPNVVVNNNVASMTVQVNNIFGEMEGYVEQTWTYPYDTSIPGFVTSNSASSVTGSYYDGQPVYSWTSTYQSKSTFALNETGTFSVYGFSGTMYNTVINWYNLPPYHTYYVYQSAGVVNEGWSSTNGPGGLPSNYEITYQTSQ